MKQTWRRACLNKIFSVITIVTLYLIGRWWWFLLGLLALILQKVENSSWSYVTCGVGLNLQCKVILGLIGRTFMRCIPDRALSTCLTWRLLAIQLQIRKTVEYHFGVVLQLWIVSEVKPAVNAQLKFVPEFKSQVGFWKKRYHRKLSLT